MTFSLLATVPTAVEPFILQLGPLTVTGFGLAVLLGFVIGQVIGQEELRRRGHDPTPVGDVVVAAVVGFLIGAKVYYALLMHDWTTLWSRGGFVFWGGLIGGIGAAYLMIRRKRVPFLRIADVGAIGIAAGYAIGRTGCWAVGDDYGRPWISRFAVAFPNGAPPSTAGSMQQQFGVPIPAGASASTVLGVYPTQLYEVAMGMIMFIILWRLRDHKHAEGWLFGVYMVLAGIERFIVEFFRAKDDRFFGTLTMAQVLALGFVLVGFAVMQMTSKTTATRAGIYA
ncbi:MAG: prolipoprotein diacylglyceryl transferase [Gemmatimonadota bacterium]|nr:prolipoprotein diacylglyceryl transferase [Gemmatimonadota bacterium]